MEAEAVSACLFGLVEGGVGAVDDILGTLTGEAGGSSDTQRDRQIVGKTTFPHGTDEAVGEILGFLEGGVGQEQEKLLAAPAAQ